MASYLTSLLFIIYINGESIQIINPGFEEDDPYLLPNSNSHHNELIGWTLYDPFGANRDDSPGVSRPGACDTCTAHQGVSTSFNDPIYGDSAPEGNASLYLWADTYYTNNRGSFGVEQELISTFEPLTSYTLSAKVGNQGSNCWSQWNGGDINWCDKCDGFSGYIVQLVADNIIVAQDDNSIFIADQKWQTVYVNYTTSDSDATLGKPLKIRLLQKNDETATSNCLMFDDVVLTANTSITSTLLPTAVFPTIVPVSTPSEVSTVNPSTDLTVDPTTDPLHLPSTLFPSAVELTILSPSKQADSTRVYITSLLYSAEIHDESTTFSATEHATSGKHESRMWSIDTLITFAAVLIAICGTLCIIAIIMLIIRSILKEKEDESLKLEMKIASAMSSPQKKKNSPILLQLKHGVNKNDHEEKSMDDVMICDNSDSEQLYVKHVTKQAEEEEQEDVDAEELYDHEGMKRMEENMYTKQTQYAPENRGTKCVERHDVDIASAMSPQQKKKSDPKHGFNKNEKKEKQIIDDEAQKRNTEATNEEKVTKTAQDITVAAMIGDKIFASIIATEAHLTTDLDIGGETCGNLIDSDSEQDSDLIAINENQETIA